MAENPSRSLSSNSERVVIDVAHFKELVWAVDRHNFRPGDALDAMERAVVADAECDRYREALEKILAETPSEIRPTALRKAREMAREALDA